MTHVISLTKYEHEVLPKFRAQLGHAESVEDVKKFFVAAVQELLSLATGGELVADYEDIKLQPDDAPYYTLNKNILDSVPIKALGASDLSAVMQRIAEQAAHHHNHLAKHNEKTNLKIFHH